MDIGWNNGNCVFGISLNDGGFGWVFGDPWMRAFCNVFDIEEEFYTVRNIIIDPTCLLMLVTKGQSICERIAQFIDVLAWFSITGFLFNGTLLGWRRECSIIPHTSDVDIAMFAHQHSDAFIQALKSGSIPNFKLIQIYGKNEDSYEIQVVSDGVRIDLFYVYEEKQRNISYITGMRLTEKQQIKWLYPHFTEICASELHGHFVHLPCDVEKLLLVCRIWERLAN
uniref:Fukutin n=1 Tax=Ditylenchus dipsaci TaxID=166011 RepID=A0A915ENA2_9BILA